MRRLNEDVGVNYSGSHDVAERPHEISLHALRERHWDLVVMALHKRRDLARLLLGGEMQNMRLQGDTAGTETGEAA